MNRLKQAKTSHRRTALSLALYSAGIVGALAAVPNAYAVPLVGLTFNGDLVTFDSTNPNTISAPITITGLQPLEDIFAIDFRPSDGLLYGIGNLGNIYTINPGNGAASNPPVRPNGGTDFIDDTEFYGFDFNPTNSLLRLTSTAVDPAGPNNSTNRSIDIAGAVTNQTDLVFAAPPPTGVPNVDASAYTNNFSGTPPASTVLYGIDGQRDILVTQSTPQSGSLTQVGTGLGADFGILNSLEIVGANQAFAVAGSPFTGNTPATLYTIDLAMGTATLAGSTLALSQIGPSGAGAQRVVSITSAIQAPAGGGGGAGAVQFSATTLTVAENVGNAVLTVIRPAGSTGAVNVTATPTNGTGAAGAVAPGDFTATPITVMFGAADLSRPVNVPIIDDTAQEGAETFTVVLSAPTGGATLGASTTATVTISANDTPTPPPPPPPAPAPTDDDDGGCTVNANGKDAGLLILLLGGALAALRRRMKR